MKNHLLIIVLVLFQSCFASKNFLRNGQLVGKWRVTELNNDYIIQITKDSILKMYAYDMPMKRELRIHAISKDRIELVSLEEASKESEKPINGTGFEVLREKFVEPELQIMNYELRKDTLLFFYENIELKTEAISCRAGVCDEQKDFFREQGLNIDLSYIDRISDKKDYDRKENDLSFYIGKPKEIYAQVYGAKSQMWSLGKFIKVVDIPFQIEKNKKIGKTLKLTCFIDRETKMEYITSFIDQLKKCGIEEIEFGVRGNQDVSQKTEIRYVKKDLSQLEIENQEISFGNWIKGE